MRPFYVGRHTHHRRIKKAALWVAALVCAALILWIAAEPKLLQVEKVSITTDGLDKNVGRLRIVYLSDIHYGSWPNLTQGDLNSLMTRVNEQKPDLVLLGGDYANDPDGAVELFRRLPTIRATYGAFAVTGEHDRGSEEQLNQLKTIMRQKGITPLVNETAKVRIGTQDICLAGLDGASVNPSQVDNLAKQCLAEHFVIFMGHDPAVVPQALSALDAKGRRGWFDLGLFGHTHGGQIPLISGSLGMPSVTSSYRSGWYQPNRLNLLVSNGVGTSGIPMRLGCPPMIHVITLISGK